MHKEHSNVEIDRNHMAQFGNSDRQRQHHIYRCVAPDKMQMLVTLSLSECSLQLWMAIYTAV